MSAILQDLRFALRQLRKSPVLACTAILVLALGTAASTAIFAFVDAALVKPLPFREPSRLVALFERLPIGDRFHISYGDYLDWKQLNRVFTSLDVYRPERIPFKTVSGTEEVPAARVSDGFFRTLGVAPILGRDFFTGEDRPGSQRTVILSYATWQTRFTANKHVLGETITLDGHPCVVIGVLPPNFHFAPVANPGFWITLDWPSDRYLRFAHPLYGVARLKPGITTAEAYADLTPIARQIAIAYPRSNRDRTVTVIALGDAILGDIRPTLLALLGGAGLLALIGFVDVASLLLVRAESRRREIAVRGALGASWGRLARQFAVEGFLLAGSGCVLGLFLTAVAIRTLAAQIPRPLLNTMPYLQNLHFNLHLLFFAVGISVCGGVLFSAGPILQLLLSNLQQGLMEGGRAAAGRAWRRAGASLVVVELAITVVLLLSAGLLTKSFYRLLHEDLGMATEHLAVLHVLDQDDAKPGAITTEQKVRKAMAALPGVLSVGGSQEPVLASGEGYKSLFEHFRVAGRSYLGEGDEGIANLIGVGYFETLRVRLLQGRFFAEEDNLSKPRVAIINRTMAEQVFPGEDPLGKSLVGEWDKDHPIRIVGIVDDLKDGPLDGKSTASVYRALNQNPANDFYVTLRAAQSEGAMLSSMVRTIHQIDPGLIADGEETMTDRINNGQAAYVHRSAAALVTAFASIALLLGTVGLYGVVSYSVGQRTREIGVRMALGAHRASVYHLILKEACWLAVLGVAGGLIGSLAAATLISSMLFAVSPWDPVTLISVVLLLATAALLASYFPARRAASLNPTEALRTD